MIRRHGQLICRCRSNRSAARRCRCWFLRKAASIWSGLRLANASSRSWFPDRTRLLPDRSPEVTLHKPRLAWGHNGPSIVEIAGLNSSLALYWLRLSLGANQNTRLKLLATACKEGFRTASLLGSSRIAAITRENRVLWLRPTGDKLEEAPRPTRLPSLSPAVACFYPDRQKNSWFSLQTDIWCAWPFQLSRLIVCSGFAKFHLISTSHVEYHASLPLLRERLVTRLATAVLALILVSSFTRADDWPQWMGPNRDGVWRETGIVDSFPANGPKSFGENRLGPDTAVRPSPVAAFT